MSAKSTTVRRIETPGSGVQQKGALDQLCINTIRTLSMDAVQKANSGHPGTPMALAPVAYTLWQRFLRFDPEDPIWPNRDRFVLSNGHASMLLYALLHLAGVKAVNAKYERLNEPAVTLDDIKTLPPARTANVPGHPEYHLTVGRRDHHRSAGPGLRQQRRHGHGRTSGWRSTSTSRTSTLFDYDVYAFCGDGDMMEGVSERGGLARRPPDARQPVLDLRQQPHHHRGPHRSGLQRRRRGAVPGLWLERACGSATPTTWSGWPQAIETFPAHQGRADPDHRRQPHRLRRAAQAGHQRCPRRAAGRRGDASGQAQLRLARGRQVPGARRRARAFRDGHRRSAARRCTSDWVDLLEAYRAQISGPGRRSSSACSSASLPDGWDADLPVFPADAKGVATRDHPRKVLNAIAKHYPWLIGGAADLAPSTKTSLTFEGAGDFEADKYGGRNLHFGIREHAMGAVVNGLALSKLRAYGSTFLIFSDYMKPPIRLSALMELPVIFVFTHDSIGVGEDGPTHQPVEQLRRAAQHARPDHAAARPTPTRWSRPGA